MGMVPEFQLGLEKMLKIFGDMPIPRLALLPLQQSLLVFTTKLFKQTPFLLPLLKRLQVIFLWDYRFFFCHLNQKWTQKLSIKLFTKKNFAKYFSIDRLGQSPKLCILAHMNLKVTNIQSIPSILSYLPTEKATLWTIYISLSVLAMPKKYKMIWILSNFNNMIHF